MVASWIRNPSYLLFSFNTGQLGGGFPGAQGDGCTAVRWWEVGGGGDGRSFTTVIALFKLLSDPPIQPYKPLFTNTAFSHEYEQKAS